MKILSTLIFSLLTTILFAQTVNYQVEIVEFRISGCDDGFGSDEEPTGKHGVEIYKHCVCRWLMLRTRCK